MKHTIYTATLARAAQLVGGQARLAELLDVPPTTLARWMSGRSRMPMIVFLRVIEFTRNSESEH